MANSDFISPYAGLFGHRAPQACHRPALVLVWSIPPPNGAGAPLFFFVLFFVVLIRTQAGEKKTARKKKTRSLVEIENFPFLLFFRFPKKGLICLCMSLQKVAQICSQLLRRKSFAHQSCMPQSAVLSSRYFKLLRASSICRGG